MWGLGLQPALEGQAGFGQEEKARAEVRGGGTAGAQGTEMGTRKAPPSQISPPPALRNRRLRPSLRCG